MKYSVMVEYALHSLVYLIDIPDRDSIGIKKLAEFQGLSETYLSKVFGKLTKGGIVGSVPGVKGGYRLQKNPEAVSFWDVVEAIEGKKPIFQCKNIRENFAYRRDQPCDSCDSNSKCTINKVMLEAEQQMRDYLNNKTLAWLDKELTNSLPKERIEAAKDFFTNKEERTSK